MAWSEIEHTSAQICHILSVANWQRTDKGKAGRNPPSPPKPPEYTHIRKQREARLAARAEKFLARRQREIEQG